MPLTRYQIRNEYGLADPELYRAADKDDPEALLEGIAMAGLVGILRQLGDLAEFAAEIFHDLHEEVLVTAARGHSLMVRVQQLEADFPAIEKAILSRTDQSSFFSNSGMDWYPNLRMEQNLITRGDLPRCVMDSYEECRGPPRLFLLDRFDVAGAGACLKRYSDPSFFKIETASSEISSLDVQREKRSKRLKKKGSRWRNRETPGIASTSHNKLHQLFLQERVESGNADPAYLVKLKRRQLNGSPLNSNTGRSYMEKLFHAPSPEHKTAPGVYSNQQALTLSTDNSRESGTEVPDTGIVSAVENSCQGKETEVLVCDVQEVVPTLSLEYLSSQVTVRDIETVPEPFADGATVEIPSSPRKIIIEDSLLNNGKERPGSCLDISSSGDLTSRVYNYMDVHATMERETVADNEYITRTELGGSDVDKYKTSSDVNKENMENLSESSDSQSVGDASASEDACSSFKKGRCSASYSNSLSADHLNEPSDVEESATLSSSTETGIAQAKDASSSQRSGNKDIVGTNSSEPVSASSENGDKGSMPNLEEESISSSCTKSASSLLQSPGTSWQVDPEKPSTDEIGVNLVVSSAVSVVHSEIRDDPIHRAPSVAHPGKNLAGGDPSVSSGTLLILSNLPDLAPEDKGCNASEVEVESKYAYYNPSENVSNTGSGCLQSFSSPMKEHITHSTKKELEVHSGALLLPMVSEATLVVAKIESMLQLDSDNVLANKDSNLIANLGSEALISLVTEAEDTTAERNEVNVENGTSMGSEADDSISPLEGSSENKTAVRDTLQCFSSGSEQLADSSHDGLQMEPDVAQMGLHSELKDMNPMSAVADDSKDMELYSKDDEVEWGADPHGNNSDNAGHDNKMSLDDLETEIVHEEDLAKCDVDSASGGNDVIDVVPVPSISTCSPPMSLLDIQESLFIGVDKHQEQLKSTDVLLSGYHLGSMDQRQLNHVEVAMEDLHSMPLKSVSNDHSVQEEILQGSSSAGIVRSSEMVDDATSVSVSSKPSHLGSEAKSLGQSNLLENKEDAVASATCHAKEPKIEQSLELEALQATQQPGDEASSSTLSIKSENTRCWDYMGQGKYLNVSPKSCSEGRPFQNPLFEVSQCSSVLPSFGSFSEASRTSLDETPPLPPLPPVQWRIGKFHPAAPNTVTEFVETAIAPFPTVSLFASGSSSHPSLTPSEFVPQQFASILEQPLPVSSQLPTTTSDADSQQNSIALSGGASDTGDPPCSTSIPQNTEAEKQSQLVTHDSHGETADPSNSSSAQNALSGSTGDKTWPVNAYVPAPSFEVEKTNENPTAVELPRPRSPVTDAVAVLDRSMVLQLRKVSEHVQPPPEPKFDERNSLLEQIRNKSFNLRKPAVVSRPSIQAGPKTNLKVAAILEKANTIRQAMAGTDEHDDSDSWSDS